MKLLLLLILFASIPIPQQVEREEPDPAVVKFGWVKEKQNSSMIRGAQNPGGPIITPITAESRDQASRRIDLGTMEKKLFSLPRKPWPIISFLALSS